jgi:hypothetical protein
VLCGFSAALVTDANMSVGVAVQVLGCQPLTVAVCDDETGDKAMEVEIWHQRMLERQQLGAAQPGKQGEE